MYCSRPWILVILSYMSWIDNVLDLEAMLTSLIRMDMPDLGREYSYLIFSNGLCSWISFLGTFVGSTSMHPRLSEL
jgi:hypothetical protein